MSDFNLEKLQKIVTERASVTDGSSYTATLVSCGVEKCAQKLGEEAVETAIAAAVGDKCGLTKEAADLLYHLLVLLQATEVRLEDVMTELDRRTGQSGLAEKAARAESSTKSK